MELTINLPPSTDRVALFGAAERNLKIIREALDVAVVVRNGVVRLSGDSASVNRAAEVIADLADRVRKGRSLDRADVIGRIHHLAGEGEAAQPWKEGDPLDVYVGHRQIVPKTEGQRVYLEAIRTNDMTFCTGPAGTGKTYLAVAAAVSMLKHGAARRLILVRPAVEAGEKLGFLPGDMQDKVNPYLRPLLDALHDMMPFEQVQKFMQNDVIEVAPLAFMRGRTLNDSVIIMDEAQNTTSGQMLMFLTRLGHGGKMIVTGDTSQIDLPGGQTSGLIDAIRRLNRVSGIGFVALEKADIVRHRLVQRIVDAYGGQEPSG